MSALVFAGSAQFAATAVLAAGGGPVGGGHRRAAAERPLHPDGHRDRARRCEAAPLRRAAVGQGMIDFSWAASSRGGGRFDAAFMLGATAPAYPFWVGGTIVGVLAGDAIGDPAALGLDALFPAFFLCLLVEGGLGDRASQLAAGPRRPDRARADPVHARRRPDHRRIRGGAARPRLRPPPAPETGMSDAWITVVALTIGTAVIRACGPGPARRPRPAARGSRASSPCSRRRCSPRSSSSRPSARRRAARIDLDARIVGVGAAALALARRRRDARGRASSRRSSPRSSASSPERRAPLRLR